MRVGKLSENIYSRSVFKPVYKYNKDLDRDSKNEEGTVCDMDCAFLHTLTDIELSSLDNKNLWKYELSLALETLFLGYKLYDLKPCINISVVIPTAFEEADLRELIKAILCVSKDAEAYIADINVRASAAVLSPLLHINCVKNIEHSYSYGASIKTKPNMQYVFVMFGSAGRASSEYLAHRFENDLNKRFSNQYISQMQNQKKISYIDNLLKMDIEHRNKCQAYVIGEGGVYATLWEIANTYNCGFEVDLKKIPITQETIEVCDFLDINPYMLYSGGSAILVMPIEIYEAEADLLQTLDAELIGIVTENNDKIITVADERRFLEKPSQDEIIKIINK